MDQLLKGTFLSFTIIDERAGDEMKIGDFSSSKSQIPIHITYYLMYETNYSISYIAFIP